MSGAAIIPKQNRFMRNFRAAGATSPTIARKGVNIAEKA